MSAFVEPTQSNAVQSYLRPVVLDGLSISLWYTNEPDNNGQWSLSGVAIWLVVDYFSKNGHAVVLVLPEASFYSSRVTDSYLIDKVSNILLPPSGLLVQVPYNDYYSHRGNRRLLPVDERFMLKLTEKLGGFLVSNDSLYTHLRDHCTDFRDIFDSRLTKFSWADKNFICPPEFKNNRHFPPGQSPPPLTADISSSQPPHLFQTATILPNHCELEDVSVSNISAHQGQGTKQEMEKDHLPAENKAMFIRRNTIREYCAEQPPMPTSLPSASEARQNGINGNNNCHLRPPRHQQNISDISTLNEPGMMMFALIRSVLLEQAVSDASIVRVLRHNPAVKDPNVFVNILLADSQQ